MPTECRMWISPSPPGAGPHDQKAGIKFLDLPDEEFDAPLGLGTGAAVIFGATGGVMEAALRTAVETLTGEELPQAGLHRSPRHKGNQGKPPIMWQAWKEDCGSLRPGQCQGAVK